MTGRVCAGATTMAAVTMGRVMADEIENGTLNDDATRHLDKAAMDYIRAVRYATGTLNQADPVRPHTDEPLPAPLEGG